jgi:hypothetical protein
MRRTWGHRRTTGRASEFRHANITRYWEEHVARPSFVTPTASAARSKREMMYMASRQRKRLPKPLNRRFWEAG